LANIVLHVELYAVFLSGVVDKNFTFSAQTVKMRQKNNVFGEFCIDFGYNADNMVF